MGLFFGKQTPTSIVYNFPAGTEPILNDKAFFVNVKLISTLWSNNNLIPRNFFYFNLIF